MYRLRTFACRTHCRLVMLIMQQCTDALETQKQQLQKTALQVRLRLFVSYEHSLIKALCAVREVEHEDVRMLLIDCATELVHKHTIDTVHWPLLVDIVASVVQTPLK